MIERDDEGSDELGVFGLKQRLIRVIGRKGALLHFGFLMLVYFSVLKDSTRVEEAEMAALFINLLLIFLFLLLLLR